MRTTRPLLASFAAIAVMVIWGVNFVVIDWGMSGIPPLLFAAIRFAVVALAALVQRRADAARLVAFGRLDLDHLGAVVGQHLRAEGTGQHLREVQHAKARERPRAHAPPPSSCRPMTFSSRIGSTPSKIGSTSASATKRAIGNSSA